SLKRTISYDIPMWHNLDRYKKFEGTMTIIHYWKISFKIKDPKSIMSTFLNLFIDMDEYLREASHSNYFY
ncbi:hypothetical protein CARUB_v10028429mg, partial [Capsella rubella]